jgi:hypothetical protein
VRADQAPRKPRPWDPDAARGGFGLLVVGAVVSALLHGGIPLSGLYWVPRSVTELPVTMVLEALPLPPAEELVEAPDADDGPDDPAAPSEPAEPSPRDVAPRPVDDAKVDEPVKEPEPPAEPEPEPVKEPEPAPVGDAPPAPEAAPVPDPNAELAARIAERDKQRAAWLAEREKQRAERDARREARRRAAEEAARRRGGGNKGGAPEAGDTKGTPDDVHLCTATDKGERLQVRTERPLTSWIPIVPTVFAFFDTRPGIDGWLRKTSQVYVPRKRIGLMDFASPAEVMQLKLEQPRGVTIAVGRLDARCLVGLTYRPKLFPMKVSRVPVRIIDRQNNTVAALVNLTIFRDATLEIEPFNAEQPSLPFSKGALQNSKAIARNIQDHYEAVRIANQFAELFGLKKPSSSTKPQPSKPSKPSAPPSTPTPPPRPAPRRATP